MAHLSIRDWNEDDRPREKLISSGAEACSNAELLAILINNGSKGKSAVELARELLDKCDNNLLCLVNKHLQEIQSINGFGPAKACVIKAAAELGRRIRLCNQPNLPVVLSSADVARVMDFLNQVSHEEFWVLFCNVAGKLIDKRMISKGTANKTFVDYKDIVSLAIMLKASRIILCHNHPAGTLRPSPEDIRLTNDIKQICKLLDIDLPEHVIIAGGKYFSFCDEGLI